MTFMRALAITLALAMTPPDASAAALERAAPDSVGMTASGLAALKARMTEMVATGRRAGIVYAVAREGKLVALEAIGKRDLERDLPMETDTAFRIYSQSRALTAVATLTLIEEGKLRLDDPVAKYIPDIAAMRVLKTGSTTETEPQNPPMSVRHLFTYTAGLGYAPSWPKALNVQQSDILDINKTIADGMRGLAKLPLLTQPGAKWQYGFAGDVLGHVAEVASGQPLNAFLDKRLFGQIGMTDTAFWVSPARAEARDLANVYTPGEGGTLIDMSDRATPLSTFTRPGPLFSGGGGLVSTVPDYLRFAQMLLNEGEIDGVRVLRPETVREMLKRQTTAAQGDVYWYDPEAFPTVKGFGWGLSIGVRPDDAGPDVPGRPGERGWAGLANTLFFINVRDRIAAVAMSQYIGPNAGELNAALRDGVCGDGETITRDVDPPMNLAATTPAVTADELVRRAELLIPTLAARAAETELLRRLPDATMADLHRLGLIKYFQPRCYGGFELGWGTQTRIGRALARGCASTAWIATVVGTHAAYLARMPPKAQEDVWSTNPDVLVSTGSMGRGVSVRRVDGGFVITGQWSFCSGADHANWAMTRGGPDDETVAQQLYFLYPRTEFTVVDDWFVTGMRGTGSKSIAVKDLFVPNHRTLRLGELMAANPPGATVSRSYVVSYDFRAFAGSAMMGAILGAAEGAIDGYMAEIKTDPVRANDINVQLRLAESIAEVRTAAMLIEALIDRAHTAGSRGLAISRADRIASLRDRTYAARLCMTAVQRIAAAETSDAIYAESPFQRHYRDLAGMTQQIGVNWDRNMTTCVRAELGLSSAPFLDSE